MRPSLSLTALAGCAVLFGLTLYGLFKIRFDRGDIYPPYSSLRADPLGTRIFYDSLERTPEISVSRDYRATNQLPNGKDTVYLHLAADAADWIQLPRPLVQNIETFLMSGGRLVVTLLPERSKPKKADAKKKDSPEKDGTAENNERKPQEKPTEHSNDASRLVDIPERWGLRFETMKRPEVGEQGKNTLTVTNPSTPGIPPTLEWHSDVVIENTGRSWQTIYEREAHPVLAVRAFGEGRMVVATDSFFLSNEALCDDRHANLLAWLIGPGQRVIFDEAHLGVMDSAGVATLAKKYRLHGFAAALLILAGLYVWKNSSSLAPPPVVATNDTALVFGRDAVVGFIGLLRRNIKPDAVLDVCFAEWAKTGDLGKRHSREDREQIELIISANRSAAPRQRDPVSDYRKICRLLAPRLKHATAPGCEPGPRETPSNH